MALTTYWLTVEPTVSFWDAGEYITTASNLEVGHPPGAPLYQIIGAFFSIFAFDLENVALTINLMSVFASAFTILFLFWSLSLLLRQFHNDQQDLEASIGWKILGSSAVGALAFTFTDSFWFSAVEAEVYAAAACIMSILFYCGLRWQADMYTPREPLAHLDRICRRALFWDPFYGTLDHSGHRILVFFQNNPKSHSEKLYHRQYRGCCRTAVYL